MKKIFLQIFVSLSIFMSFAGLAFAQIQLDEKYRPSYEPTVQLSGKVTDQPAYFGAYVLQTMAGSLLYFAGPLAVLIIAVAGLIATTSAGNDEALGKAKKTITWAAIGLAVIMLSYVIISAVIQNLNSVSNGQLSNKTPTPTAQQPVAPANGNSGGPTITPPATPGA